MERIVTFRIKGYCPEADLMGAVVNRIKAHTWAGEVEIPARLEWRISKDSKPSHFPIDAVRWAGEDADALLAEIDALEAVTCAVPVDTEARKAAATAAARRRAERSKAKPPEPTDPSLVLPSLRFLLSPEAREEGKRLYDRLDFIPGGHRALAYNAEHLEENFPHIAKADAVLGGRIRQMLRAAGELPALVKENRDKWPWVWVACCISRGEPHFLTARYTDGKKVPGAVDAALSHIVGLRKQLEAKTGTKEAVRSAASARRPAWLADCRTPWDVAARVAERDERARLGLTLGAELSPYEDRLVQEARKRAIAACPEWIGRRNAIFADDCPF